MARSSARDAAAKALVLGLSTVAILRSSLQSRTCDDRHRVAPVATDADEADASTLANHQDRQSKSRFPHIAATTERPPAWHVRAMRRLSHH
jgi:hypothetical protein